MLQATREFPLNAFVEVAGAQFEVVGHNPDGTLNLKNDQGHVFPTTPGEPVKAMSKPAEQNPLPDPRGMRSDDYVAAHILHLLEMRKATLLKAEKKIQSYVAGMPGVNIPVGIDAVTWLQAKSRPNTEERKLLVSYTVAAQNLRADIRTDQGAALSLWKRFNPNFADNDDEAELV